MARYTYQVTYTFTVELEAESLDQAQEIADKLPQAWRHNEDLWATFDWRETGDAHVVTPTVGVVDKATVKPVEEE